MSKSCKVAHYILRVEIRNDANRRWAHSGIRMWFKCGRVSSVTSWTREAGPRRRIVRRLRRKEVFKSVARAEIRIRIDVSSDTCLHIENRYAARRCAARVDGEKIFKFQHTRAGYDESRLCRTAFERNDLFTVRTGKCAVTRYEMIRQTFYITRPRFTWETRFIWLFPRDSIYENRFSTIQKLSMLRFFNKKIKNKDNNKFKFFIIKFYHFITLRLS